MDLIFQILVEKKRPLESKKESSTILSDGGRTERIEKNDHLSKLISRLFGLAGPSYLICLVVEANVTS